MLIFKLIHETQLSDSDHQVKFFCKCIETDSNSGSDSKPDSEVCLLSEAE